MKKILLISVINVVFFAHVCAQIDTLRGRVPYWHYKYYLASGGSRWFWKDGPVVPTDFPNFYCPVESSFSVPDIRPLSHRVVYDVMNKVATTSVPDPDTLGLNPYSFNIECENQ